MDIYPVYSTKEVFRHTYDLVRPLLLTGAIVECGVAAGSNFAQMIRASIDSGIKRKYYGFDSFQGIPFAGEHDDCQPGIGAKNESENGTLKTTGVSSHTKRDVMDTLQQWGVWNDDVLLIEGWFQDTVPHNTIKSIAVLRLDGDLYESTKVCLEHLYPLVETGGLVIIDDYNLKGCRQAVTEYITDKDIDLKFFEYTAFWYKKKEMLFSSQRPIQSHNPPSTTVHP